MITPEAFLEELRAYRGVYQKAARQMSGLPPLQWVVLALAKESARPMTALADEIGVTRPQITEITCRLASKQLIHITVDPKDRRSRRVNLTAQGRKVLEDAENQS